MCGSVSKVFGGGRGRSVFWWRWGGSGEVEISDFNMEGHEAGGEYTSLEIEGSAQVGSGGEVDANPAAFRRPKTIKIALVTGRADLK